MLVVARQTRVKNICSVGHLENIRHVACRGAIDYRDVCHIRHGVENFCDHDPCLIDDTLAGLKVNLQAVFLREVFNPHDKCFDIVVGVR